MHAAALITFGIPEAVAKQCGETQTGTVSHILASFLSFIRLKKLITLVY